MSKVNTPTLTITKCGFCGSKDVNKLKPFEIHHTHFTRHLGRQFEAFKCGDCQSEWTIEKKP